MIRQWRAISQGVAGVADVDDDLGLCSAPNTWFGGDADECVGALLAEGGILARSHGSVGRGGIGRHVFVDRGAIVRGVGWGEAGGDGDHAIGVGPPRYVTFALMTMFDFVVGFVAVRPRRDRDGQA